MIFILIFNIVFIGIIISATSNNLFKKIIGLAIFQSGVLVFYIAIGYVYDSIPPIINEVQKIYANPLPQVLMLTAIVVGLATLAVAIALILRIKLQYHSIENHKILEACDD